MNLHENMAMHLIHTHGWTPEETHRSYEELKAEHDGLECPPPAGENAFGKPVPAERQVDALDCAAEVIGISAALADPVIRDAARYVELDRPADALTVLRNITDLTGAYRLLAVLCTGSPG